MVFRGDEDAVGRIFFDRLVGAAVAELEADDFGAEGQAEDLVAQADAEYRLFTDQALAGLYRVVERTRVAGAVGEENAVGLEC